MTAEVIHLPLRAPRPDEPEELGSLVTEGGLLYAKGRHGWVCLNSGPHVFFRDWDDPDCPMSPVIIREGI